MRIDVVMPPLGDAAGELVLSQWLKKVGERVEKGEPFFEVETDKVGVGVEALDSGTLSEILLAEGEATEAGEIIAYLESESG